MTWLRFLLLGLLTAVLFILNIFLERCTSMHL